MKKKRKIYSIMGGVGIVLTLFSVLLHDSFSESVNTKIILVATWMIGIISMIWGVVGDILSNVEVHKHYYDEEKNKE